MPSGGGGGQVITLPVSIANGGTGQTTAAAALAALGGVSTSSLPLAIASGGTGQITAAAALAALGGVGAGHISASRGSAGGDISVTGTFGSPQVIDSVNLSQTKTVPTGYIAVAILFLTMKPPSSQSAGLAIAIDGTMYQIAQTSSLGGDNVPYACVGFLAGDGSSHVFAPTAYVSGGTATIVNSAAVNCPAMVVLILPAT